MLSVVENAPPPIAPKNVGAAEDKTVAIVAYLTIVGFIIAVILHGRNQTRLGAFHLRQALGLMVAAVAIWITAMALAAIPLIGGLTVLLLPIVWLAMLAAIVMGLITAANGQLKPLPYLGDYFQRWFADAF